ncbi:LuxR family transcriptional regulator [Nonomuraea sp. FMUSA5-5]|uniref:LuxR family transcriptional regulator n=1 Tax=Nonomuraea composti TaxID=2720023 RepID=A0ABX1BKT9_9ACTN|nr:LuxR family transcriptional regulator [Nonomuraea sp. FMUSA5-5]NJP98336.1 LuxR family transcriptional regulator [Nonomuraea sp. FMUSA5-5]
MQVSQWQGNLPSESTRLIGRREEVDGVRALLGRSRLVTVTGVAGVGKTRIALRAAAELRAEFADGVWLVALSPLVEGSALPYAIAEALPMSDQSARPVTEVLADYLAERELLLVFDTCEHLTQTCAAAARTLLAAAPKLRVLATSRRPLGCAEERVLGVEPLPVPESDDWQEGDAVELLLDRAAATVPGFAIDERNRGALMRVCRRLEGLPLAIELAAARLRELTPDRLAERLDDRFAVLGTTEHQVYDADPPWHQALRTAIGWSHQLCTPAERLLWARASVFAGSIDPAAVKQVCADDRLPSWQIPQLLESLADKSILIWEPTGAGDRYRMLDTIREFGAIWLKDLGQDERVRRRHRDYYLALAREGDAQWMGPDQYAWYDRMTAEHDNLRAALQFALARPEGHIAMELASALWFFWYPCGFHKEGQHYLERALAQDRQPSPARTKALWACSVIMLLQGEAVRGAELAAECSAEAERQGDVEAAVMARSAHMSVAVVTGDHARVAELAQGLLDEAEHDVLLCPTLLSLNAYSLTCTATGKLDEAISALERLRTLCDRNGERWQRAYADVLRAQAELAYGRASKALAYAQAALEVKWRLNDSTGMALAIDVLAPAAMAVGQEERAAHMLGLAHQIWDVVGMQQAGLPALVAVRRACEEQVRGALGDRDYTRAFQVGRQAELDAGVAYALGGPVPG